MAPLDYEFSSDGRILRLWATLASGWDRGRFVGQCAFDWKDGASCRAQVRLAASSGCGLPQAEALQWAIDRSAIGVQWSVERGVIRTAVAMLFGDRSSMSPLYRKTGSAKACIEHNELVEIEGGYFTAELQIFFNFDRDRPDLIAWQPSGGMASGGLPSLGKKA